MEDTEYRKLEGQLSGEEEFNYRPTTRHRGILKSPWLFTILAFCAGIIATLGASRLSFKMTSEWRDTDFLKPLGDVKVQFAYNDTFPGPPTLRSEYAWLDLLPNGLGAVQHDDLSGAIVTLGVFHQLHCLMELRHAIYNDWDGERHSKMAPHHTRHCLEYLRQSIMCNADTNLEARVVSESGVKETPGWDLKKCRDFGQILNWAEEWRAFDGKIPSQKKEIVDPEVLKGRVIRY
ncbi:hypothetical protein ACMFMG_000226 [Clarireedia jacksonii]